MRLTKRQLKRIIREEYSRLKRRGLIRESDDFEQAARNRSSSRARAGARGLPASGSTATIEFECLAGGPNVTCNVPNGAIMEIQDAYDMIEEGYPEGMDYLMDSMNGLYEICQEQAMDMGHDEGLGAPLSCSDPMVWDAIQKMIETDGGGYMDGY